MAGDFFPDGYFAPGYFAARYWQSSALADPNSMAASIGGLAAVGTALGAVGSMAASLGGSATVAAAAVVEASSADEGAGSGNRRRKRPVPTLVPTLEDRQAENDAIAVRFLRRMASEKPAILPSDDVKRRRDEEAMLVWLLAA